jgi:hypothetical protein
VICPGCKHDITPTPVTFTWWGGVFGPRLLSHVQCPGCTTRFNGKTGALNSRAIAIYMVIVGLITFAAVYWALTQL